MQEFLLIFREYQDGFDELSPAEFDGVLADFLRWNAGLRKRERLVDQGRLARDPGHTLRRDPATEELVLDGPYAEARELIGGYYRLKAKSYEEAAELARDCPVLRFGGRIELRRIEAPRSRRAVAGKKTQSGAAAGKPSKRTGSK